jgi:hypothetical protein
MGGWDVREAQFAFDDVWIGLIGISYGLIEIS